MAQETRLTSQHAEALEELERSYPLPLRMGGVRLEQKLGWLEQSKYSFSWVLVEKEKVVSYIIAYPSKSQLDVEHPDVIIYVDDLLVQPNRPTDLYRLLILMLEDVADSDLENLHIEANCRPAARKVLMDHPKIVGKLGYELLGHYEYEEETAQEEFCWMRFSPINLSPQIAPPADSVIYSADLLEELEIASQWRRSSS